MEQGLTRAEILNKLKSKLPPIPAITSDQLQAAAMAAVTKGLTVELQLEADAFIKASEHFGATPAAARQAWDGALAAALAELKAVPAA